MAKTYLATQTQVQAVSDSVTTVNTQINAPSTGIEPRLATVENNQAQVTTNKNDIATIRGELDNPTTGIYKQLTDIDTEINEAGTGIKARLNDLEQGGTSTMKFRVHSPNAVYADGEVVQKDNTLYKANSAIDGSVTPVTFSEGVGVNKWTRFSKPTGAISAIVDSDLTGSKLTATSSAGKITTAAIGYSSSAVIPDTHDAIDLGSESKAFKGGHFQYVNFMSAASTNEGNVDADTGSLGIFGTTELALGHGNNTKDMTFTASGITAADKFIASGGVTLNSDMVVVSGKNIKFEDVDSTEKEGVNLRINVNDLCFYGVNQGVEYASPAMRVSYDNKVTFTNTITSPGIPRVTVAGRVGGSNGAKLATTVGSYSATRAATGYYVISGLNIANTDRVMISAHLAAGNTVETQVYEVTKTQFRLMVRNGVSGFDADFHFTVMEY